MVFLHNLGNLILDTRISVLRAPFVTLRGPPPLDSETGMGKSLEHPRLV